MPKSFDSNGYIGKMPKGIKSNKILLPTLCSKGGGEEWEEKRLRARQPAADDGPDGSDTHVWSARSPVRPWALRRLDTVASYLAVPTK
jgi:hypothetical protein